MTALGKSRTHAGGCNGFVGDNGVRRFVNRLLRNNDFSADRTVTALGKSRARAGGCNGFVGDDGVAFMILRYYFFAVGTFEIERTFT